MEETLVSIAAVSVWGWRADGLSTLVQSQGVQLPSPYPEGQGVSVSVLLDAGARGRTALQALLMGGDETGSDLVQEREGGK